MEELGGTGRRWRSSKPADAGAAAARTQLTRFAANFTSVATRDDAWPTRLAHASRARRRGRDRGSHSRSSSSSALFADRPTATASGRAARSCLLPLDAADVARRSRSSTASTSATRSVRTTRPSTSSPASSILVTLGTWFFEALSWVTGSWPRRSSAASSSSGPSRSCSSLSRGRRAHACPAQAGYAQRALIVGTATNAQLVARKLLQHPEYGISLVGFVDASPAASATRWPPSRARRRGAAADARRRARDRPRRVRVLGGDRNARCCGWCGSCRRWAYSVDVVPRLFEHSVRAPACTSIEAMQLVSLPPTRMSSRGLAPEACRRRRGRGRPARCRRRSSRASRSGSSSTPPGPVLFRQTRLGLDQRPFTALKFRTMRSTRPPPTTASTSAER